MSTSQNTFESSQADCHWSLSFPETRPQCPTCGATVDDDSISQSVEPDADKRLELAYRRHRRRHYEWSDYDPDCDEDDQYIVDPDDTGVTDENTDDDDPNDALEEFTVAVAYTGTVRETIEAHDKTEAKRLAREEVDVPGERVHVDVSSW